LFIFLFLFDSKDRHGRDCEVYYTYVKGIRIRVIMFNATFIGGWNRSTRRKGPTSSSHWQTLSHNVVSSTPRLSEIRTHNVGGDRRWLHR